MICQDDEEFDQMVENMDTILQTMWGPDYKDNPSKRDTDLRFIKYLLEFHSAGDDPDFDFGHDIEKGKFPKRGATNLQWLYQFDIPFRMICEHHLLPAYGHAHIAYKSDMDVLGLSKFPRLVDEIGRSGATLQEDFTHKLIDSLRRIVKPEKLMVVVEAEHTCVGCRGVNKPGIVTVTQGSWNQSVHNPNGVLLEDHEIHRFASLIATRR